MTLDEAKLIARVLGSADGGCEYCARALASQFATLYPQFIWAVRDEGEVEEVEPAPVSTSEYGVTVEERQS